MVVAQRGSGTTFVFTKHLSAISDGVQGRAPAPARRSTGPGRDPGKGNEGVTARSEANAGFDRLHRIWLRVGRRERRQGPDGQAGKQERASSSSPRTASGKAALAAVDLPRNLIACGRRTRPRPDAYPIVTYTWIHLLQEVPRTPRRCRDAHSDAYELVPHRRPEV